jgi:hypothetical protein
MLAWGVWVSFFALLGMTVYRESTPIQPEPKSMSATLFTLWYYVHPSMYASLGFNKVSLNLSGRRIWYHVHPSVARLPRIQQGR